MIRCLRVPFVDARLTMQSPIASTARMKCVHISMVSAPQENFRLGDGLHKGKNGLIYCNLLVLKILNLALLNRLFCFFYLKHLKYRMSPNSIYSMKIGEKNAQISSLDFYRLFGGM